MLSNGESIIFVVSKSPLKVVSIIKKSLFEITHNNVSETTLRLS